MGGLGGDSGSGGSGGSLSLGEREGGNASVSFEIEGSQVGVSAVEETNSILVRSTPQAWRSIKEVIDKLDVMPMQVHIEAQIATVELTGDLSYGVNWYFENAVDEIQEGLSAAGRGIWGDISGSIEPVNTTTGAGGLAWTFLGRNAGAIIRALDSITDVRMLSTPSVFVRNNSVANLLVGDNIPIASVSFDPTTGTEGTFSQVQYLETGNILKVRPRATKDGTVFLDIVQEISIPGAAPSCGEEGGTCNPAIATRKLQTRAAVQSGDTVMLAGLIDDSAERGSSGLPGLNRLPIIGGLFGQQTSNKRRRETIVLITPTIVRDSREARDLTDEYTRRFRAMEPLRRTPSGN
jgi:general secretion pathway protein D